MKYAPLVLLLGAVGCHGIEHLSPTAPAPARSTTAARLTVVTSPGQLPIGGGSALLTVEALSADGSGVITPVDLSVSGGTLAVSRVTTDTTGHATASWDGTATATLTATSGDVVTITAIRVTEPATLPPPSVPPPPTPQPTPEPLPIPAPALSMTLNASPLQVAVGSSTTLTVSPQNLNPGEFVTAYQWDWEGTGTTFDETTTGNSRAHIYAADGIKAPIVRILTSSGRSSIGTGRVIVYRP
jgi:hypothetical protein